MAKSGIDVSISDILSSESAWTKCRGRLLEALGGTTFKKSLKPAPIFSLRMSVSSAQMINMCMVVIDFKESMEERDILGRGRETFWFLAICVGLINAIGYFCIAWTSPKQSNSDFLNSVVALDLNSEEVLCRSIWCCCSNTVQWKALCHKVMLLAPLWLSL